MLAIDPKNEEYLSTISSAAFTVSLDDKEVATNAERVRLSMLGDGLNRWYDKTLQFIVSSNGKSSWIFDHAYIDGLIIHGITKWVQEAIYAYQPPRQRRQINGHSPNLAIKELEVVTSPELDAHIQILRKAYLERFPSRDYNFHRVTGFGKDFLLEQGAPVKAVFNLLIQLATHLSLGHNIPSWEPVSLAHYHKSRIELIQYSSPPVVKFCASATDAKLPAIEKRKLMLAACQDMNDHIRTCAKGQDFHRLLLVMGNLWPKNEATPALLKNPIWKRSVEYPLISNMVDGVSLDVGHPGESPETLWIWVNFAIWDAR